MARELREALLSLRNIVLRGVAFLDPALGVLSQVLTEYERLGSAAALDERFRDFDRRIHDLSENYGRNPATVREAVVELLRIAEQHGAGGGLRHAESCFTVMQWLSERSATGQENDPDLPAKEAQALFAGLEGVDENWAELELVSYELQRAGLIRRRQDLNARGGWRSLVPTDEFFWRTDGIFAEWNPKEDARHLCQIGLVERPVTNLQVPETAAELGWKPRRMNPATEYLRANGQIRSEAFGATPFTMRAIMFTPEARFFIEEARHR